MVHEQGISVSGSNSDHDPSINTNTDDIKTDLDPSLIQLPDPLIEAMIRYTSSRPSSSPPRPSSEGTAVAARPQLLPIQQKSYRIISSGRDAVLFSPTGTGKTLAYVLPLAARLHGWKRDGSLRHQRDAREARFRARQRRGGRNDTPGTGPSRAAIPSILVVEPSRELARQVGKVWGRFHPTVAQKGGKGRVATVYGGVPVARHAALLGGKTDVVVGSECVSSSSIIIYPCGSCVSFLVLPLMLYNLVMNTRSRSMTLLPDAAPGRLRELIREKYLSTHHVRAIVLDEADMLLNFKDNPEIELLLEGMENDYQLVLASATINKRVEKFVGEVMELEVGEEGYVVSDGMHDDVAVTTSDDGVGDGGVGIGGPSTTAGDEIQVNDVVISSPDKNVQRKKPVVDHWSMATSAASRTALTSDLIVTIAPRRAIVFAPSKAEVEAVAREMTERLSAAKGATVHVLHGDMVQMARSRTIAAFGEVPERACTTRVLVATDVASRGLDLPAVDLVVQHGVPRKNGKDGTYDPELYVHRTGRAGRYGNARDRADAILLIDRSQGEGTTLPKLKEEMMRSSGVEIRPRQLPSSSDVMKASYERAFRRCEEVENNRGEGARSLVRYFVDSMSNDLCMPEEGSGGDGLGRTERESFLMHRLATAMAALSGLEEAVSPRSLLTYDPRDRTIRVYRRKDDDSSSSNIQLTPPEVTKKVKSLGSGKLGRIYICSDGSAVFDLGAKKAELLLKNVAAAASSDVGGASLESSGWHFEMPSSLFSLSMINV